MSMPARANPQSRVLMKTKVVLATVGLCSAFAVTVFGENARGVSEPGFPGPGKEQVVSSSRAAPEPALTLAEAQIKIAAARRYPAHPPASGAAAQRPEARVTSPDFEMVGPPPPAPAELKPAAPAPGYVWVPGHYMPVEGKWRWVRGEWAVPATPSSVWIPARYDPQEKKWSPGYWQPDRPTSTEPDSPTKDAAPTASSPY